MTKGNRKKALEYILEFENSGKGQGPVPSKSSSAKDSMIRGLRAERLLESVFTACGFEVQADIRLETGSRFREIDLAFTTVRGQVREDVAVEVKATTRPVDTQTIHRMQAVKFSTKYHRFMIVSRSGFTHAARHIAETVGLGWLDLLDPSGLRSWIDKAAFSKSEIENFVEIQIRTAMRRIAQEVASHPEMLTDLEWRDLERLLREVFEGIGFETRLTRPAKDGGFDLELRSSKSCVPMKYLVEVKHWTLPSRPGSKHYKHFVKVVSRSGADRGLLLSSSGFRDNVYEGIQEFETHAVSLGGREKILGLCRTFYKIDSELWTPEGTLDEVLFENTI